MNFTAVQNCLVKRRRKKPALNTLTLKESDLFILTSLGLTNSHFEGGRLSTDKTHDNGN